ncbi:ABC transporter permease [Brachybacterium sp. GCM10030267]|uniref:ABC transporter permease n=1 Tax=unclassified Brachybacterium TaxID=2623841 RepID=UPI00360A31A6
MTSASAALIRNEARLYLREPMAWFWVIAFPTLLLIVLGFIPTFREADADLGGQTVIGLYVSICILLSMVMVGATAMPMTLIEYRSSRILRRLRTTPVSPLTILGAQAVVFGVSVAIAAALCLTVGRLAYGAPLPQHLLGWLVTFILALAAMLATGGVITALTPNASVGNVVSMMVMLPTMFTTGVWFPVQTMPQTLQTIVHWTPMGAATEALNQATMGAFPDALYLLVVAGWTLVLSIVAVRTFRWE